MISRPTPEYKMSYEDRVREETWAIASSKIAYEREGSKWAPCKLNLVVFRLADVGKPHDVELTIPDEEDYFWAKERVDRRIEESRYCFGRIQRAKLLYSGLPHNPDYINPGYIQLNASWNGMRDPLSVNEVFYLMGLPDDMLKEVFHFDPEYLPPKATDEEGFFGFAERGQQRLAQIMGKPIAFVYTWDKGRWRTAWNLSSKEVFYP